MLENRKLLFSQGGRWSWKKSRHAQKPERCSFLPARQLPLHLTPLNPLIDHQHADVEDEVGDLADEAFARFAQGGDDHLGRFLADLLGHASAAAVEEFGRVRALGAFLATVAIWWASSLPVYMYFNPSWSHAHSAFAVALFLWYWHGTRQQRGTRQWCILGAIAGLMLDVYYPNAMVLAVLVVEAVPQYFSALRNSRSARSPLTSSGTVTRVVHRMAVSPIG